MGAGNWGIFFCFLVSLVEALCLRSLSGTKHYGLCPVPPIPLLLKTDFSVMPSVSSSQFILFAVLLVSLAAKFAEVFVHSLQNVQIFHQSGKYLFSSICVFLFLVLCLPASNLFLTTTELIAQHFQRTPSRLFHLLSWCEPGISVPF